MPEMTFSADGTPVLEMAYKEIELAELNDLELGTTVTPTVIKGGTVPNGIPDHCHLYFDVRYRKFEEAQRVKEAFERIAAHSHIDGTHTDCIYKEYQVPFDETPDGIALADFVAEVSRELGMDDMEKSIWAAARMPATLPLLGCRPSVLWESAGSSTTPARNMPWWKHSTPGPSC